MAKATSEKTKTSPPAIQTDLPPDDYVRFGILLEGGAKKGAAAEEVWPQLRPASAHAKASVVCKDPQFVAWQVARKDIDNERARQITASYKCDYESRLVTLCQKFQDPDVNTREQLQIHDKLTAAEGRSSSPKKEPASGNTLENLIGAAAAGAAFGKGVSEKWRNR